MKMLKSILVILFFTIPVVSFSQTRSTKSGESTYQRKTRKTTTSGGTSIDTIRKENAPVLQDNGNVNTTGIVDGSRSSTGRPGSDTLVNYTVKRKKKTIYTEGTVLPDTAKRKKIKP